MKKITVRFPYPQLNTRKWHPPFLSQVTSTGFARGRVVEDKNGNPTDLEIKAPVGAVLVVGRTRKDTRIAYLEYFTVTPRGVQHELDYEVELVSPDSTRPTSPKKVLELVEAFAIKQARAAARKAAKKAKKAATKKPPKKTA